MRVLALGVALFGVLVNIAGYDLGNLWAFSDLANIILCYVNVPLLYRGFAYVLKSKEHFVSGSTEPLTAVSWVSIRHAGPAIPIKGKAGVHALSLP